MRLNFSQSSIVPCETLMSKMGDNEHATKVIYPKYYITEKELLGTVIRAEKMGWFMADLLVHQVIIKPF